MFIVVIFALDIDILLSLVSIILKLNFNLVIQINLNEKILLVSFIYMQTIFKVSVTKKAEFLLVLII